MQRVSLFIIQLYEHLQEMIEYSKINEALTDKENQILKLDETIPNLQKTLLNFKNLQSIKKMSF